MSLFELDDFTLTVLSDNEEVELVREISLSLESGETLCIVGESGSGKTVTALSIIRLMEFVAPVETRGEIRLGGVDLTALTPEQMRSFRGRRISMVFQEALDSLNPSQRIGTQLAEAYRPRGSRHGSRGSRGSHAHAAGSGDDAGEHAATMLAEVGLDPDRVLGMYPHQLSGGMQQRVMIAMALMSSPDLLLADEPTTALDVTTQAEILKLFRTVQQQHQMACVFITHDMGVAAEIADRIAVFYAGRLVEVGTTEQILRSPQHRYTRALMECVPQVGISRRDGLPSIPGSVPGPSEMLPGCRFAPRCAFATPQCTGSEPTLTAETAEHSAVACFNPGSGPVVTPRGAAAAASSGTAAAASSGTADAAQAAPTNADSPPILALDHVRKTYFIRSRKRNALGIRGKQNLHAVDDVSFTIAPGEFFGLVGESGSGKTTLGMMVAALEVPSSGTIAVGDFVCGPSGLGGRAREFRRKVQLIFQDPQSSLDPRHTVARIVGEPLRELTDLRGAALRRRVTDLLDEVGLPSAVMDKVPSQISGGQRQRVAIARAIAPEPELIVADEPTSALDVSVQGQVMNLLLDLRRERNLSYLFITHNLSLILSIADRVAVMKDGHIIELAPPETIVASPQHDYTRTLLAANPGLAEYGR